MNLFMSALWFVVSENCVNPRGRCPRSHVNREHTNREHTNREHTNREHTNREHTNREHTNREHTNREHTNREHTNREHTNREQQYNINPRATVTRRAESTDWAWQYETRNSQTEQEETIVDYFEYLRDRCSQRCRRTIMYSGSILTSQRNSYKCECMETSE